MKLDLWKDDRVAFWGIECQDRTLVSLGSKLQGLPDDSKHTCIQLISRQEVPLVFRQTFNIKVLYPNNKKSPSGGNTFVLIQHHKNKMRNNSTVKHRIRMKRTKAYYFPAQSSVSTSGTAGVDTSTVMLLQYTNTPCCGYLLG